MKLNRTHLPNRRVGKRQTLRSTRSGLGLVIGLAFAVTAQAEPRAGAFQMLVAENSVPGQHLIEGDVDAALALSETRNLNRFSALNDRCVSLTLLGELEKAETVCNDAVREARRTVAGYAPGRAYQGVTIDRQSRRAMAFTNRGVLHALQGRGELARTDFNTAIALNGRLSAAMENLAVLEARPAMASID
jgi:hypothetical protein